ncbi:MAG TPA: hypothetical protein VF669_22085 [Tepidisphaeraceae bacterium]|jgi:uncharacterized membrane protein YjfL (UPF0719 family)
MAQWDFDGDELLFLLAAGLVSACGALEFCVTVLRPRSPTAAPARGLLLLTPPLTLVGLYWVLQHWADPKYVVSHPDYVILFMLGGGAWLTILRLAINYVGVSIRDDVIERNNTAATAVTLGAIIGNMAIYTGGNVGAGPTIWTTILPATVASLIWLFLWLIIAALSPLPDAVALDRDLATGIRHGGILIATSLVLARAIAGDWTSWTATFSDMIILLWPVLPLTVLAVILHRALAPSPARPQLPVLTTGVIPALFAVLLALAYLRYLGPAEIGKTVITYEQYMNSK